MYIIAVNKSQEFLLNVRRLFYIFFRRQRKGFDFDDESMFFSTTSYTGLTLGLEGFSYARLNVQLTVNSWGDGSDGSGTLYILCSTGIRNQRRQLRTMRPEHQRFVEACC